MDRRQFVKVSTLASGGLLLSFSSKAVLAPDVSQVPATDEPMEFGDLLSISPSGDIHYQVIKHEMGQGVATAMAMVIAEELHADWEKVIVQFPDTDMKKFQNDRNGGHDTGGSCTMIYQYDLLRKAGATAREMLIEAAAQTWKVPRRECRAEHHHVVHDKTQKKLGYGKLARTAARLSPPLEAPLVNDASFKIIGKAKSAKLIPDIVTGRATYGLDAKVSGMLYAVVARSPVFKGRLKSFDDTSARAVSGVRKIFANTPIAGLQRDTPYMPHDIREGVVVVADSFWAAQQARNKLEITWDDGPNGTRSTADFEMLAEKRATSKTDPTAYVGDAHATADVGRVKRTLRASYVFPHQLHNCMEPLNCTAQATADHCEIWVGSQAPNLIFTELQRVYSYREDQIKVHNHLSGGGFGRRYYPDMAIEAVFISREAGGVPVKMLWTREDDHQANLGHLFQHMEYQASLDGENNLFAWYEKEIRTYTWGAKYANPQLPAMAYQIPNVRYDFENMIDDELVHSSAWRGVTGHGRFYSECFVDEIAAATGKDPYQFRLELLKEGRDVEVGDAYPVSGSRLLRVLKLAAEKSGWGKKKTPGHGMGMAACPYGNSYVAAVAEVVVAEGSLNIVKMTITVDCGKVINPSGVVQQITGGIVWSLTALLYGGLPIRNGRTVYSNFHQNKLLRMRECPPIEVHLVDTDDVRPWGVGEISSPLGVPSVLNAIYAATGKRIRRIPIDVSSL